MDVLSATDVRKNWSVTLDKAIHEKPVYIKRTRDNLAIINIDTMKEALYGYRFTFRKYVEKDNSVTLSADKLDIVVNDKDEYLAEIALARDIKEYAEDFYDNYAVWSVAPNRKAHIPYILKALMLDEEAIREELTCQDGRN